MATVLVGGSAWAVGHGMTRAPEPAPRATRARMGLTGPPPTAAAEVGPRPPAEARSASALAVMDPVRGDDTGCSVADRGRGVYGDPIAIGPGQTLSIPAGIGRTYDVIVHLHGGAAIQRILTPENLGPVLVTVDAGVGSNAYRAALADPDVLTDALERVGVEVGNRAQLKRLIVSSWSAGYGGVREILRQAPASVDAVVLLDSLHASYDASGELDPAGLRPFLHHARRARSGEATMVLSHSEIRPPGYASTSEVADYLLGELDAQRRYAGMVPGFGVELKTTYDEGGLHVRGLTGTGTDAHCAHLRLLPQWLRREVLPPRALNRSSAGP